MSKKIAIWIVFILAMTISAKEEATAQKVGFLSSKMIREQLPDAKIAEQRVQTMVEEWKREIASMEEQIAAIEFEIKKNRLIWSESERANKEKEYKGLILRKQQYAKEKFDAGGEYDVIVNEVMRPVEEKIYAAVQEVASKEKYDIIWDQSSQPLPYVNFKYDITLKILRLLGVDVEALEKEQQEKISKDPRNIDDQKEKKKTTTKRRRSRTATKEDVMQEQLEIEEKKQQEKEILETK
ncbi:MAG: OmpH family outer membrane protein [Ignavibacteria bacterium]|jgi:outer membrane protein|nr:OmpH family outer membrane protein [Ignavibacteria bacterium]